jgi:hypothetical protein
MGHGRGYIDVVLVWLMLYALLMHRFLLELCSCGSMLFLGLQAAVHVQLLS